MFIFVCCIGVILIGCFIFLLNFRSFDDRLKKLDAIVILQKEIKKMHALNQSLDRLQLNPSQSLCVFNSDLTKSVYCHPDNILEINGNIINPATKQKIIIRAHTGGGFVNFSWKQKINNQLKDILAKVFRLGTNKIAILTMF